MSARGAILRAAMGIGVYAGAFGATFGAVSVGSGLSLAQTMALSLVMFTGASQFAFVGVAAAGSPYAAVPAALLLGVRNAFYGVSLSEILHPHGLRRLLTAHFVIDETTAMAIAQPRAEHRRYAFWATGIVLCSLWQLGTLVGALLGAAMDPRALGLDAAAPAVFLALLWPALKRPGGPLVALGGALVAVALIPVAPAGVPVIAAAGVALLAGLRPSPLEQQPGRGGAGVTALWVAVALAALGSYAIKLAGVSLPDSILANPSVQRVAGYLPVAMLAALVCVQLFGGDQRYALDWRTLAGVAAGTAALLLRQGLLVVFLVAVGVTALLRLVT